MLGYLSRLYPQFLRRINAGSTIQKRIMISYKTLNILNALMAISFLLSISFLVEKEFPHSSNDINVYSQVQKQQYRAPLLSSSFLSEDKVTIHMNSVRFAPLTDTSYNQLKVVAEYQTNDPTLVNTPLSGTMKVYGPNGTLVKSSSIQKGYVLGQAGAIQFATSFSSVTLQSVKADIYLTDASHTKKISNTLKVDASIAD
jgi:hypothetical protein